MSIKYLTTFKVAFFFLITIGLAGCDGNELNVDGCSIWNIDNLALAVILSQGELTALMV